MWKVDQGKGGIFFGRITARRSFPVELPDYGDVEVTELTIEVTRQISLFREMKEVRAIFLGGIDYRTTAQPSDEETAVGTDAVFLLGENPFPNRFPNAFWLGGLNAVFRVRTNASGERVVLGKGEGSAVPKNARLEDFLSTHELR